MLRRLAPALAVPLVLAACASSGGDKQAITLVQRSSSMEPTLHCARDGGMYNGCEANVADELIVEAVSPTDVERGDILVFTTPPRAELECGLGGTFVKRVVGLPGERIVERSGYFSIDGKRFDDSGYVKPGRRDDRSGYWIAPKESYFVVGDNRAQSCDSRRWGSVAKEDLHGKVVAVQRPSGRFDVR